jgi:hypothetical protein
MTIRFGAIGVTLDRRTGLQLESARFIEQQRLDLALEAEWRRRVRENEHRRASYRTQRAWVTMAHTSRENIGVDSRGSACLRTGT